MIIFILLLTPPKVMIYLTYVTLMKCLPPCLPSRPSHPPIGLC